MKQVIMVFTILFLLSSCSQPDIADLATVTTTPVPHTATPEPSPTFSPVDALLEEYFTGEEIDVSGLDPEEFSSFSAKLAERRNAQRGVNPIIYNNEAFISPENYRMTNYDGHPDLNETIQMYLPIAGRDSQGNLQIVNHAGETVTIENSADVDWNMRVTDPLDPRINWPTTKILDSGYVEAQYRVYSPKNPTELFPAILLDNNPGNIYLSGEKADLEIAYRFFIVETDKNNNPMLARMVLAIGMPHFNLYAEGSSLKELGSPWNQPEYSSFNINLEANQVYYIGGPTNQDESYRGIKKCGPQNYIGVIVGNEVYSIINNQYKNNNEMIVLAASMFMKRHE